ncbi:hypothetical protein H7992_13250 [Sporosarcina sp. resist]|uniref:hypothetical protein n=1 Tax=Sporosarcina TaxID=1569 RepID=UPI000A719C93|nr:MULTISPECIES: hypothetical protein [Sporosarcina]QNK86241.1 hypothetical protein H7992_13250 [Sporosarcina sp. resist]
MIIYDAYYDDGDYPNGINQLGIYSDLDAAKEAIEKEVKHTDILFVGLLKLDGKEF